MTAPAVIPGISRRSARAMTRMPRIPLTVTWGVVLAAATALISGVSVFANAYAVKQLP